MISNIDKNVDMKTTIYNAFEIYNFLDLGNTKSPLGWNLHRNLLS